MLVRGVDAPKLLCYSRPPYRQNDMFFVQVQFQEAFLANHRSAIKRHRQSVTRRARNRHYMSMVRNSVKLFCTTLEEGDVDAAQDAFRKAERTIRRVAGKGVLHKRTAARKVSRLSRALNNYRASNS